MDGSDDFVADGSELELVFLQKKKKKKCA